MFEIILQIIIAINLIWFVQWLAYYSRKEMREFRKWKKQQDPFVTRPDPPATPQPPVDHPDVIVLDRYRNAE